ncbi:MAG TPA: aldo/keto reductase [Chloroflexi bacterium]|jgi:myo-inositol catabolism protein IolS|nr:aldo/keto reductase [Chloroflexota bacterium]
MLYRDFGNTGWKVSAIGLGTWNIGNQWGKVDDVTAYATIREAYECGVNLFDTAESYGVPNGLSEERLGTALAGIRHQVYVVSKVGHWGERTGQGVPKTTPDMIRLCVFASLGRMHTDWLDVVLCHEGDIADPSVYLEGFEAMKQAGYVRHYGISTDRLDVLQRFNADGNCSVVEVDYSLLNRAAESELLPYCREQGIGVLVRGPLRKGLLSGKYTVDSVFADDVRSDWNAGQARRAQVERELAAVERLKERVAPGQEMVTTALRYVISHPAAPVAIPGAKSPEQARMNAEAGERELTAEERQALQALL